MNTIYQNSIKYSLLLMSVISTMFTFAQTTTIKRHIDPKSKISKIQSKSTSNSKTRGVLNGHEWIDLGLPSGTKWATCNLGANIPNDCGGYYAWGETRTKSSYDWSNCFDCVDPNNWEKDNSWDTYRLGGKTIISPSSGHDTARENWGGTWRMPRYGEIEELCKKCKWIWTSQNGLSGYTVTGPNGNSIFLPAAGSCFGTDTKNIGEYGYYWSSKLWSSSFASFSASMAQPPTWDAGTVVPVKVSVLSQTDSDHSGLVTLFWSNKKKNN